MQKGSPGKRALDLDEETQPLVSRHLNRGPFAALVITDNQPNAGGDLVEETQPLAFGLTPLE